jgi:c-di-GMP-binding flagellar brake protein YcgR
MVMALNYPQQAESYRLFDYPVMQPERRRKTRRRMNVRADAHRLDHSLAARSTPRLEAHVTDISDTGLAATLKTELDVGERVAFSFPAEFIGLRNMIGRVVRCSQASNGSFKVALKFERSFAA